MDPTTQELIDNSPYGYIPTLYVCGIYVALFGLATLLHTVLAVRFRLWWMFPTLVAGGLCETIGWAARVWSSQAPDSLHPFIMQMTTTIIAPSFMTAANFLILGIIISRLGPQYSRLSPKWYSIVFIVADLGALIIQAVGGATAASAVQKVPPANPDNGAHIMLGGIFFQIVAMTVYAVLAVEVFIRVRMDRPVRQLAPVEPSSKSAASLNGSVDSIEAEKFAMKPKTTGFGFAKGSKLSLMILSLGLTTVLIYIRGIYRTVELIGGWNGAIITTEIYFNVLDALPITLAMFTMIVLHPGWLLKETSGPSVSQTEVGSVDSAV
ncbi:RTA1-domain-containing protein [Calocera viscosa TUFC12733]|uniref:RTA1-domain-containing protein n=1 Tax=Calocera viscosa (strain TUFC12733) TaxID=1330018 RepID=A0A167KV88_CALVF|nr:RTA1-domain-containing protein [Calocera viscosa TUFC12733]